MAPATPSALKPPEQLLGVMDEGRYYALSVDWAETVADVIWPVSVQTYSAMRNDPAIAAVLAAITLPIRRATWTVDPAGCRPEVAQMVADDLGLKVLGDDTPTAARVRGVSWSEHLRAALMSLTYGHAAFEMLADVSSGQARLVGLYERLQHTISFIHSTPNGDFGGISQLYYPDKEEAPEIPAQRMVFYSHAREGSAWHGRSILRAAYAPFLLRREMQRVLSTSSRRFGMGVPTVEWAAGTTPTPEQLGAAQRAASAARVGDTAGLAMPPGASLVLKGLSGGTPDTLAFIKWLGQEITKSCLAQFLDLGGESSHGSYAMASEFVDLFTLSIAAVAEEIADQITRQAAARIVEWNHGTDEPVPRVVVTDIGTKHEFTADALLQLMQAGAITADPALEEYVRKAYQLPSRSTPWTPPVLKGAPANSMPSGGGQSDSAPTPVAAAARRPSRNRREPSDGQMELPLAAAADPQPRDLTADEQASGVDFEQVQSDHDAAVAVLVATLPALLAPIAASLVAEVSAALAPGGASALASLTPDADAVSALGDAIDAQAVKLAKLSVRRTSKELKGIGLPVSGVSVDEASLAEHAQATAQLVATGMAQAAARTALLHNGPGVDAQTVTAAVQAELDALTVDERNWIVGSLSSAMAAAQHAGRMAAYQTLADTHGSDAAVWVASEVNDKNVCPVCHEADGRRFDSFEEALAMYPTGRNVGCLGRDRCRGVLFVVPAK